MMRYTPSRAILILVTITSSSVLLGCLVCGFLLHFAPEEPSPDLNGGYYSSLPTIALLVSAITTFFALILGCCGTLKDSKVILLMFSAITLLIAMLQLGSTTVVFTFTMKGKIQDEITTVMLRDLKVYSVESKTKNIFNTIQKDHDCCGVHNYSDWWMHNATWEREADCSICLPESCCSAQDIECTNNTATIRPQGCLDILMDRMEMVVYSVFGFSVALALLQVLTSIIACYGAYLIRRYKSYRVL